MSCPVLDRVGRSTVSDVLTVSGARACLARSIVPALDRV